MRGSEINGGPRTNEVVQRSREDLLKPNLRTSREVVVGCGEAGMDLTANEKFVRGNRSLLVCLLMAAVDKRWIDGGDGRLKS